MTIDTARAGDDVYIDSAVPGKRWLKTPDIRVSSTKTAFSRIRTPAPKSTSIIDGNLVYAVRVAFPGAAELTLQRVDAALKVGTLTPANQPGVIGDTVTVNVSDLHVGDQVVFPLTDVLQAVSYGAADNGYRIISDSATELVLHSLDSGTDRPFLRVEWSRGPQQPTKLKPAYGSVSIPKPKVSCDFVDRSGSTKISRMQVQVDPTFDPELSPVWGGPDLYDTGAVTVEAPTVNLARTDLPGGIFAGFPETPGAPYRVRTRDGAGVWSPWSDPVTTWYDPPGELEIVAPGEDPDDYVEEYTPAIVWAHTPNGDEIQTHYQVMIALANRPQRLIYDSGKLAGDDNSHSVVRERLAHALVDGEDYRVWVRVWDSKDREGTEGSPVYIERSRVFTLRFDATVDPVEDLAAVQIGNSPWIDLTFSRDTPADSYTLVRDGKPIAVAVPGDIIVTSTTYRWRDWSAKPGVSHIYQVRANVNNKIAASAESVTIATQHVVGIWVGDPESNQDVVLGGKDFDGTAADLSQVYQTFGSGEVVRQVMSIGGLSGSVTKLVLRSRDGRTWESYRDVVNDIKGRPTDEFRLVLGDYNIPVAIGDVTLMPHPSTRTEQVLKTVSFNWWQTGEHDFDRVA